MSSSLSSRDLNFTTEFRVRYWALSRFFVAMDSSLALRHKKMDITRPAASIMINMSGSHDEEKLDVNAMSACMLNIFPYH